MSAIRPKGVPIELDGKERSLMFTLNAIEEIQEETGRPLHDVVKDLTEPDFAIPALKKILAVLLNDEAERMERKGGVGLPRLTERDVGGMIDIMNYYEAVAAVLSAYGYSMPEPEDDDPNGERGTSQRS